ncbi:phosphoenolpyruvate--protein phosphotransferase [Priestia filamentosa]|uniref:phosphoenolpyruvate--protein phosphotransferase n=1 Tax=Priestia filamentosa TaxID=1402861 RepID=UPI00397C66CE
MNKILEGIAASAGISIGKAFILKELELDIEEKKVEDINSELERFTKALDSSKKQLQQIKERTLLNLGKDKAEIFEAHLLILEDPELIGNIKNDISHNKVNAEYAVHDVSSVFVEMFESMENEYMKERAADIRDVSKRVILNLMGIEATSLTDIQEDTIIIANDLTPSDTAQLNPVYIKGFATDIGGRTSHTAIMARSLELPAVVGTKEATEHIKNGDLIVIDGLEGKVVINPKNDVLTAYQSIQQGYLQQKEALKKLVHEETTSKDGFKVELAANIGTPEDLKGVIENGAEGVGLYRTEFLYMGRDELPSEEEQFNSYKIVLEKMDKKPVVIRTLDIGGDKELSYLELPKEMNPFLGYRAIRLCLEQQDIFRTQLRALLRASVYGNLKIMFPMVATVEEFRQAKAILEEEKQNLISQGHKVSEDIEVGIMVEIPSTAVASPIFAKEVDFFSIGTNDLIQYTMAADRMNERVSYLYQPYNPAILRLVKMVIEAAHAEGKWVGMCGEMAGDSIAIPLLLGLGLDEFSMSASSILPARALISKINKKEIQSLLNDVLLFPTSLEVEKFVKNFIK